MDTNEKTIDPQAVALQIAEYRPTAAALAEVRSRLDGIVYHDLGSKRQMEAAKADRRLLVTMRTTLESKRKELKAPALERSRLIDAEAKDIEKQIRDLEEPIDLQIKAEETRAESERLAKLEAERVRVETIHAKIGAYRELPGKVAGWPSARIQAAIDGMGNTPVTGEFEEFTEQASDAYEACIARLKTLLHEAIEREAATERARQQEKELREAQERIARMELEMAEALEREERREREEYERIQAAERAEAERVRRIAEEEARAEREALEAQQRAEREQVEALERAAREAAEQERQAQLAEARAQADKAEARAQADKAEAARKEAARKADAARREALGITEAAQALLSRVQREGHGQWPEAVDLGEVLAKQAKVA